jgi:hypothetical protein
MIAAVTSVAKAVRGLASFAAVNRCATQGKAYRKAAVIVAGGELQIPRFARDDKSYVCGSNLRLLGIFWSLEISLLTGYAGSRRPFSKWRVTWA